MVDEEGENIDTMNNTIIKHEEQHVLWFGIFKKTTKKGLVSYIFQLDFLNSCFSFVKRGAALKRIPFYCVLEVVSHDTAAHLFTIEIVKQESYLQLIHIIITMRFFFILLYL